LIGIVLLLRRDLFSPSLAPFTTVIVGGLLFLFMVFGFTNAREWMAQQTTVNRATLHLVPLITVFIVVAYREFAARWAARHPAALPEVAVEKPALQPEAAVPAPAAADAEPAVLAPETESPPAPQSA